jgi:hypothetical protein
MLTTPLNFMGKLKPRGRNRTLPLPFYFFRTLKVSNPSLWGGMKCSNIRLIYFTNKKIKLIVVKIVDYKNNINHHYEKVKFNNDAGNCCLIVPIMRRG